LGTGVSGTAAGPGNQIGIDIVNGANNTIGGTLAGSGNVIAFNTGAAVTVDTGTGNAIRQNSIFANDQGIFLVNGGNADQPAPTLTAADSFPGTTMVEGQLSGFVASTTYTIEFFASAPGDPLGPGQAHVFLGSQTFTTNGSGAATISATFSATVPVGQVVTATATSPADNTSEFAAGVAVASAFVVTNTNDSGIGSLRQVINNANANPGTDTVTFQIPGLGPYIIQPSTVLPTITDPVVLDGTSQTGFPGTPIIQINGGGLAGDGLTLGTGSSGSTVKGMDIYNFSSAGILIQTNNNLIEGDYLGTGVSGTAAGPGNQIGIDVVNGANNTIGGAGNAANTIGFNHDGIDITGSGATGNVVLGNYTGTNASGDNLGNGGDGIFIADAPNNTVGGTGNAANTIGFNFEGIDITGSGATGNVVLGNYIGTNASGANLGNVGTGVVISDAPNNTIGGAGAAANTIGNNASLGIDITGSGATGNVVLGSDILGNVGTGVVISDAPNNTIGGTGNAANTIGNNASLGIEITGSGATGNVVLGNYIGTNASGANLGNGDGVLIENSASSNTIGAANTIGHNANFGIDITGTGATGNVVQGNFIGTNASDDSLGNGGDGVLISDAPNNTIGGAGAAANTIGNNGNFGIDIIGTGATGNVVQGNFIGTNADGTAALGNFDGVLISGAPNNTIGGANTIGRNANGIVISGSGATGNVVQGNFIGTNASGADLGNGRGVLIENVPNNTIGGANTIAFNSGPGVQVDGSNARG